jgi:urease accessory protein
MLDWDPEPGVAASGADHVSETRVRLAAGACLRWREEFVLGRYGEDPGTWTSRMRVSVEGRVALSSELSAGPASPSGSSQAALAGARAVSTLLLFDPDPSRLPTRGRFEAPSASAVALPLAESGVQVTAWGDQLGACRSAVEKLTWLR